MKSNSNSHPGKSKLTSKILYLIGKYIYALRFKIVIQTLGPLEPKGPLLILSKHCSNHDIVAGLPSMIDTFHRDDAWCIIKDNLVKPYFFGFFLKIGGIPVDRKNPEKSKEQLLFARKTLYDGNLLVIFPEQSRHMTRMGKGKSPGFRFIVGKPAEPLQIICVGLEYKKGFPRTKIFIRFGNPKFFAKSDDPEIFLHDCMLEIANLSNKEYKFPKPEGKKAKTVLN
ncbi:MAG: lysophospholipid acyltransferase family protein [Leptospira sp.]|nr:lysophospholipid acyltransferase family protein [Leptospira sp.]